MTKLVTTNERRETRHQKDATHGANDEDKHGVDMVAK